MGRMLAGVLALALVGTLGSARATAAPAQGGPVVLVHGWHSAGANDTLEGSTLALLGRRLSESGLTPFWADKVAVDPAEDLFESADRLAEVVSTVAARHPGQPVRIIAHSYGGLVSRAFLETERYGRLESEGLRVSSFVTLGSPMGGIDLWLPLLFVLGDPLGEPSVWQLTPAWMTEFNRTHVRPGAVTYTLVAGDARGQVPPLWLLPASDGAVSVASAHALKASSPGLVEKLTDDVHTTTGLGDLFGWRSLVDNEATFQKLILPGLTGTSRTALSAADESAGGASADVALSPGPGERRAFPAPVTGSAASFSHTPVEAWTLSAGETRTIVLDSLHVTGAMVMAEEGVELSRDKLVGTAGSWDSRHGHGLAPVPVGIAGSKGWWVEQRGGPVVIRCTNNGRQPAQVAWLGLLHPDGPRLALDAREVDGRLQVRMTASGGSLSGGELRLLRPGDAAGPSTLPLESEGVDGAVLSSRTGTAPGVAYVQADAVVDGVALQTEMSVWVGAGTAAGPGD